MTLIDALADLRKGDQAFIKLKMEFDQYQRKVREQMERLQVLASKDGQASAVDIKAIAKELYGV